MIPESAKVKYFVPVRRVGVRSVKDYLMIAKVISCYVPSVFDT